MPSHHHPSSVCVLLLLLLHNNADMVIFGLLVLERRKDAKERVCLSMFGCAEGKYAIAPNALPVAGELFLGHLFF